MWYNLPGSPTRYAKIAEALWENVEGLTTLEAAERSVSVVRELSAAIGIPQTLAEFGVREADCDAMAPGGVSATRLISNNPRAMTERDAALIYRHALFGTLW